MLGAVPAGPRWLLYSRPVVLLSVRHLLPRLHTIDVVSDLHHPITLPLSLVHTRASASLTTPPLPLTISSASWTLRSPTQLRSTFRSP